MCQYDVLFKYRTCQALLMNITYSSVQELKLKISRMAPGSHRERTICQVQQADGGDGRAARDGRDALAQVDAEDDLQRARAHRERRLDQAAVQLGQRALYLPREERHRAEHQRHNRAADVDGRTHDRAGDGQHPRQQDDERDGAEQAHELVEDLVDDAVLQDAAGLCDGEQHAQRQTQHERDRARPDYHQQRIADGLIEVRKPAHDIGNPVIQ